VQVRPEAAMLEAVDGEVDHPENTEIGFRNLNT